MVHFQLDAQNSYLHIIYLLKFLGIIKLDKEKNQCIREKHRSREYSKGNKTVPGKVATTHTEEGHKQGT